MILRMGDIDKNLPITFVYGSRTWMDRDCGYHTRFLRNESHVDVEVSQRKMSPDIDSLPAG